jgi:hypothetical protein
MNNHPAGKAPKTSFQFMLAMLKPFVPQSAFFPMKVFGLDKNEWTAALLEEIDADQIPAYYGGTLTDPDGDPKCSSMVLLYTLKSKLF